MDGQMVARPERDTGANTREERRLLANTLDETLDAIALEDAIANAPRSGRDAAGRVLKMGHPAGKMVRQLVFWEGKGQAEDYAIHKVVREWRTSDARLTERQLRTATRVLKEHGLLETWGGYRPSDRRQTVFYRLNLWETLRAAFASEITTLEERLEHERRTKQRARLEERLAKFKATLDDLELRFAEPEEAAGFDAFGACARCGEEFCDGDDCLYDEAATGWHDPDAPDPTDEDAPDQADDPDWLPQDLATGHTEDTLSDYPRQNVGLPQAKRRTTPDTLHPLQKSNDRRERHEVHASSSFTTQNCRGDSSISVVAPRPDFQDEEQAAISTPPPEEAPGDTATEVTALHSPKKNTTPEAVRGLLEEGGGLHHLVDDALEWDRDYPDEGTRLLVANVARTLRGDPEEVRDAVVEFLAGTANAMGKAVA